MPISWRRSVAALLAFVAGNAATAQGWEVRYSHDVSLKTPVAGQEFSFDFPQAPGSVHYVTKPIVLAPKVTVSATFTITMTGAPQFDYRTAPDNTCDRPASVRLFLQRRDDPMTGQGQYEFYRWWSNAGVELKAGTFTLAVPLQPASWVSVMGKDGDRNPAEFSATLADLSHVGVTFGGGCFYGHGVRVVNGRATFTMKQFEVR